MFIVVSIYEEDKYINCFQCKSNAIDGDNQSAVRMNKGQTIEDPKEAIKRSGHIIMWPKLLYRLPLINSNECWAVNSYMQNAESKLVNQPYRAKTEHYI